MWQVEVEEYNRMAQDSFPAEREYYKTLKEAKSRFESFKSCKDTMLFINRELTVNV